MKLKFDGPFARRLAALMPDLDLVVDLDPVVNNGDLGLGYRLALLAESCAPEGDLETLPRAARQGDIDVRAFAAPESTTYRVMPGAHLVLIGDDLKLVTFMQVYAAVSLSFLGAHEFQMQPIVLEAPLGLDVAPGHDHDLVVLLEWARAVLSAHPFFHMAPIEQDDRAFRGRGGNHGGWVVLRRGSLFGLLLHCRLSGPLLFIIDFVRLFFYLNRRIDWPFPSWGQKRRRN